MQRDRLFCANRFEIAGDRAIESPGGFVEEETRPRIRQIERDRIGKIICESINDLDRAAPSGRIERDTVAAQRINRHCSVGAHRPVVTFGKAA